MVRIPYGSLPGDGRYRLYPALATTRLINLASAREGRTFWRASRRQRPKPGRRGRRWGGEPGTRPVAQVRHPAFDLMPTISPTSHQFTFAVQADPPLR